MQKDRAETPEDFDDKVNIKEFETMEDNEAVPMKAQKFFEDARNTLRQEFNFYTFGIELN